MKSFNTKGPCRPGDHYMVNSPISNFKTLIDKNPFISICRPHLYSKSTTLNALRRIVEPEYIFLAISFKNYDASYNTDEKAFCDFIRTQLHKAFKLKRTSLSKASQDVFFSVYDDSKPRPPLSKLIDAMLRMRSESRQRVVLALDDMDAAKDSETFPHFLGMLSYGLPSRTATLWGALKCLILVSVADLKSFTFNTDPRNQPKICSAAVPFEHDMSLPPGEILEMIEEYKDDHRLKFDTPYMSSLLTMYTSGYPFLVSKLCALIHDQVGEAGKFADLDASWTHEGLIAALKILDSDPNVPLYHPLARQFFSGEKLKALLEQTP
ncbi:MAG: ATP-binding protein [Clostridiales bacterium]|nr:ATP-binding protein [Clostridiales bacterium]